MYRRQLVSLALLNELERRNRLSRTVEDKILFLMEKEKYVGDKIPFYSFFPHKYGPFSLKYYDDLRYLAKEGYIENRSCRLTPKGKKMVKGYPLFDAEIYYFIEKYPARDELVEYVYKNYKEYTIRSELKPHKKTQEKGICTVGYEKKNIDSFLNTLIQNNVDIVIDTRKNAFSMNYDFGKQKLNHSLTIGEIEYHHFPELGIESEERKNLKERKDYLDLFKKYRKRLPKHQETLNKIKEMSRNKKVALLCFEKNRKDCHRWELARYFEKTSTPVKEIE